MNKAIKAEWVAALRSGDYEQGRGGLCVEESYCCLGVLYDACFDDEWEWVPDGFLASGEWGVPYGHRSVNIGILPPLVREKAGISACEAIALVGLNDDQRCSFGEIADHIEREL